MDMIEAQFSFYKAGQGSFYGGQIRSKETNKVFTIVYDCGTSSFIAGNSNSLNNEITAFKEQVFEWSNNNEIELLFISHLDYDHVSGLKRLLTEFKVKNIILPYIEKQHRQFFIVSFSDNKNPNDSLSLDLEDYTSFIERPDQYILRNSENTQIYFVRSDSNQVIEYQGYGGIDSDPTENAYPRGTPQKDIQEFIGQSSVSVYENNLQFFIGRNWEFTTYVKSVNEEAIKNLHKCLKKRLNKNTTEYLSLEDLKMISTEKRKEAHKCYTDHIGEINSHGLVLLHGPIRFRILCSKISPECDLSYTRHPLRTDCCPYDKYYFTNSDTEMLGTLLFGDTSINPSNNPINFPNAFKNKLFDVHVVQMPHHGSAKNWNYEEFKKLKIGNHISWNSRKVTVCNFGYGNKYGHPSHEVLDDLRSEIFLNTQFTRLNVRYKVIHH